MNFLFPKVYAATGMPGEGASFDSMFSKIKSEILTPAIYLLFVLALVYFLYGVFEFVKNAENPEKRAEGGQHILWGLIGMFIMLSVKGIINLLMGTFGIH
jgi:hypothetical protein